MDIMVEGRRSGLVAGMLHEKEIPFSVAVPNVDQLVEKEQRTVSNTFRRSGNASRFRKYFLISFILSSMLSNGRYGQSLQLVIASGIWNKLLPWFSGSLKTLTPRILYCQLLLFGLDEIKSNYE